MIFVWIGLLIQILLFDLLKPFIQSFDVAAIWLIGVNFIFVTAAIFRFKHGFRVMLLSAYIIRVLAMFWDIYAKHIFILPHSGIDSERFLAAANLISTDLGLLKGPIYGSIYSKLLGVIFYFTTPQRLIAQYINVLIGLTIIMIVWEILGILEINKKTFKIAIAAVSFMPHAIIFSAILLRENIISIFLLSSFYFFIKWYKEPSNKNILYSLICLGISSSFHSGVIGVLVGYIFMYLFYKHETNTLAFTKKTILLFIVFAVITSFLFGQEDSILLTKFNNIEQFGDLYDQANVRGGGSAYLTGLRIDSFWKLVIFGSVKSFYFLTSPLPMNWRGISDIISFGMDGLIFLILIFYITSNFKKHVTKNPLAISIFIMVFSVVTIFGIGVANAGTAMRHRQKILPIIIVLYAIVSDLKLKNIKVNYKPSYYLNKK